MSKEWSTVFETEARSVQFCDECGSLLSIPSRSDILVCPVCGASSKIDDISAKPVVMKSMKIAKRRVSENPVQHHEEEDTGATVKEDCPKCGYPELSFRTAQLRSADEGQTVFYLCKNCGYTYSVNN